MRDRLLKTLDALTAAGNADVRNYTATGFVEGLHALVLTRRSFVEGLGRHLRAEVEYKAGQVGAPEEPSQP